MQPPHSIVITGASAGIGAALARALAAPGRRLLLIARDRARLAQVGAEAEAAGAAVTLTRADVADPEAMARHLRAWDDAWPTDLLIANAGVLAGHRPDGRPEGWEEAVRVSRINYLGVLNTVEPLLPRLRQRGCGRIVLMSSLAGLRPMPHMPAYSASKAAVRAYGIALRGALREHGVGVTVVCPGFVTTPMTARHFGPRPFEMPADRAAALILRALARGRSHVTFPWPLALLTWLGNRLPPALGDLAAAPLAARILPEPAVPRDQRPATTEAVRATAPSISASVCSDVRKNLSRAARSGTAG